MRKKIIFLVMFSLLAMPMISQNRTTRKASVTTVKKQKDFDWMPLINAIIQVESRGNRNAVSKDGQCVGVLQIKPILVRDCNEYQKKVRYTLNDRRNVKKSIEMFILIQKRYNKTNSIEKAIRIWNGGCKYSKAKTQKYYEKVMKEYRKQYPTK